jgi:hypothetical protein
MKKLLAILGLLAAPVSSQAPAPVTTAVDYTDPINWLCLPAQPDVCGYPLPTMALNPAGYGATSQALRAANPPIDCFYVYPTVSRDAGMNSDMEADSAEQTAAVVQFARFATLCRPFAPIYRQATVRSIGAVLRGQDPAPVLAMAYADVRAAWRHYIARHNNGRPFVLIGHSQGSIHLIRLLAEEIEGRRVAGRMLSAVLLGFNVEVPEGQVVGGTFRSTPLCTRRGQTGCIITYVSFRAEAPPPANALFGRAATPGRTIACTNPAALGRDARAPLNSIWFAGTRDTLQASISWSSEGPPPAPFLTTNDLVSAACVHDGPLGYLAVTVNADPADARTDQIPGDVSIAGMPQPGWGLHLVDINLTMGDLIAVIEAQRDAFPRRRR